MARPPNPRRGSESRLELARPIKPAIDVAALTELRDALAGLAQRIVDPREEVKALSEGLARQAAMLEQLATLQNKAATLQRDTGRQLAQLRSSLAAAPPMGFWRRLLAAVEARWPALGRLRKPASASATVESPPAKRLSWILADGGDAPERRAVLIVVFGLSPQDRQAVVSRLGERPAAAGIVPVYVTDCTDFESFREARAFFEHLPLRRGGHPEGGRRDAALYAARRFQLLCDKWKPIRIVGFGPVATRWLVGEAGSSRLPEEIRALIAASDETPVAPQLAALDG